MHAVRTAWDRTGRVRWVIGRLAAPAALGLAVLGVLLVLFPQRMETVGEEPPGLTVQATMRPHPRDSRDPRRALAVRAVGPAEFAPYDGRGPSPEWFSEAAGLGFRRSYRGRADLAPRHTILWAGWPPAAGAAAAAGAVWLALGLLGGGAGDRRPAGLGRRLIRPWVGAAAGFAGAALWFAGPAPLSGGTVVSVVDAAGAETLSKPYRVVPVPLPADLAPRAVRVVWRGPAAGSDRLTAPAGPARRAIGVRTDAAGWHNGSCWFPREAPALTVTVAAWWPAVLPLALNAATLWLWRRRCDEPAGHP